ncbi:hypothetical protein SERP2402 [Staphylococcus epidermidis RP62A]|uniref:Uncharacterized protein n=1 Tax=Staphylococcus epidermidis (strain ATCC 35984 / DSM 28319 / BCRC 17069 / CCUG 31568 / BM 3577 / RP62A) TaxID=176279 RepID=Q5HKE4_STAEQ|nr:hypothetical protein SERP2402 [Staphylococcus epidermidis RP62A]BFF30425.1 hypothetical protein KUHPSE08_00630 [Staphylococcus epidermidis]
MVAKAVMSDFLHFILFILFIFKLKYILIIKNLFSVSVQKDSNLNILYFPQHLL